MEFNFDSTTVEKDSSFDPIPAGTYKALIASTEIKDAKTPGNRYLSIRWNIVDGEYKNRVIFETLNLWRATNSENDVKTMKIANIRLAEICEACGVLRIKRTEELHNKIVYIDVVIKPAVGVYSANNDVKKHHSINGGSTLPTVEDQKSGLPFGN